MGLKVVENVTSNQCSSTSGHNSFYCNLQMEAGAGAGHRKTGHLGRNVILSYKAIKTEQIQEKLFASPTTV